MSTLGGSNPGDTTITHDTTGTAAGLLPEKRKRISLEGEEQAGVRKKPRQNSDILVQRTAPEGLDSHRRKQSCLDKDWYVIGTDSVALSVSEPTRALEKNPPALVKTIQQLEKILSGSRDPVTVSVLDLAQALGIQKNHPVFVETIQQLEKILSGSRDSVTVSNSGLAQTLRILKNDQVLVEATQQLEKILSGVGDIRIIASKILSRLSSEEMVLLSCTTTIDREDFSTLSDWQRPGYWFDKKEEEAFCRKFDYIMSEVWDPRDIFDKWEAFYKVLTKSIHLWVTKVCVRGWEADCDIGHCDNLTVIRKLKHQNVHRIYGEEKKAIRDRSGSVTQWDLVGMRVMVNVLSRR